MKQSTMGFGKHNNSTFSSKMARRLSAPELRQVQQPLSGKLRKLSTGIPPRPTPPAASDGLAKSPSKSKFELPPELKRRHSSHRRSIYSIDFEIEAGGADDAQKARIKDGRYGWVVVMAVTVMQVMGMGFLTSLGIFYIEWREYFEASAAATGLTLSLSSVVLGLTSPLAVGLAGLVGPRPLVMVGTVLIFIGLLATAFVDGITQLMFTVGVLTAFGYGLALSPAILVIGDYFEEKFALANGISFSGVSIGQLIWPPLCVDFIYRFGGWRGAILIIAAVFLHIAVCGALWRPIKKTKSKRVPAIKTVKTTTTLISIDDTKFTCNTPKRSKSTATMTSFNSVNEDDLYNDKNSASTHEYSTESYEYSLPNKSNRMKRSVSFADATYSTENVSIFQQVDDNDNELEDGIVFMSSHFTSTNDASIEYKTGQSGDETRYESSAIFVDESQNPPSDKPIRNILEPELPILNLTFCHPYNGVQHLQPLEPNAKVPESEQRVSLLKFWDTIKIILAKIISFLAKSYGIPGVFLSPLYVTMIPAIIGLGTGWYATITYQAARAVSVGISEGDASFLLSLMGIGSLIGRAGHGWFIDKGFISNEMLLQLCLAACSASSYLICFMDLYPLVAMFATIQGMAMGIANTLCLSIMKRFAKPNFEEAAVGMLYCIWGFGDLIGGVTAGYLYDATGDYDVAFYFAGSSFAVTMILVYIACLLRDRIITKRYAKFLRKKHGDIAMATEDYDNPAFVGDVRHVQDHEDHAIHEDIVE